MANLTIHTTPDAIEAAINRDERGDALAILDNARDVLRAASEPAQPSLKALRTKLNAIHLYLDSIESHIQVCSFALRAQACDVDNDVATVLGAASDKVSDARERLRNAFDLLAEVAP